MTKRKRSRLPKIRWSRERGMWFASCGWLRVYVRDYTKRAAEARFWEVYNRMHEESANTPVSECYPLALELKRRFARFDARPKPSRKGRR